MNPQASTGHWKTRVLAEFRRDKKKTAILTVLALAAAVLVVRALLPKAPQTARAASSLLVQPRSAAPAGQAAPAAPPASKAQAAKGRKGKKPELASVDHMTREITRDIFRLNPRYFPQETAVKKPTTQPGKAGPLTPETVVQQQAQALLLESTIMSDSPVAMINGRMKRVGQEIHGFRIVKINDVSCVVSKDGIQVTLYLMGQAPKPPAQKVTSTDPADVPPGAPLAESAMDLDTPEPQESVKAADVSGKPLVRSEE